MGRLVRDARLETREARRRLLVRKEPHWRQLIKSSHLGYYKGAQSGAWCARVRLDGRYHYETIGTADDHHDANDDNILNYAQAQEKAKQFAEKLLRSEDHNGNKYTVKDAVNEYLADFKANGKKSLYATETQIKAHILPCFGNKLVNGITFSQLNSWKNKLATTDKRARSSNRFGQAQKFIFNVDNDPDYPRKRRATANRIINTLKAVLNHAYNTNRVASNDAWKKLKPFKNVSEPKIRFLSEAEVTRLLNACNPSFRLVVRGALLTGARYGELTQLKVGDYSTVTNTVFIAQSKSGKSRHIPLNSEGISFFEQLIIGRNSKELMFVRDDCVQWKKNYQARPLEAACKAAKITPTVTFHILRHTYASALAIRGVSLQVIAAVLGHSDTRITHKHYAHLIPSYIADAIKEHLPDFGKTGTSNIDIIEKLLINSN
jgi:integrase